MMSRFFLLLAVSLLPACGIDTTAQEEPARASDSTGSSRESLEVSNGSNLNGSSLNGSNLNGSSLNGSNLNGSSLNTAGLGSNSSAGALAKVSYSGARIGQRVLDQVVLVGSVFEGTAGTQQFSGLDFVGAHFDGTLVDGTHVVLEVTGASQTTTDTWRYDVRFRDASNAWQPICVSSTGTPVKAVAVPGRWDYREGVHGGGAKLTDPTSFTFACEGSAIEKCVTIGYKPWATVEGTALDPLHQACVRLIRADYCGDGRSFTTQGRKINLYDALQIQKDTRSWLPEAEWDESGARCVSALNRSLLGVVCSESLLDLGCGSKTRFNKGTLLITETPAGPLDGLL